MDSAEQSLHLSEKQLFQLFAEVDLSKKKTGTFKDYQKKVSESVSQELQNPTYSNADLISAIKRYKYRKAKKMPLGQIVESASSDIVLTIDILEVNVSKDTDVDGGGDDAPPPVKKSRGPEEFNVVFSRSYNKDFSELSEKWKKKITEPLIEMMEKFIEVNEFSMDINQLLGYLVCWQSAKKKSAAYQIGSELLTDSVSDKHKASFTAMEAVAFMHSLTLSKDQTRKV